MRAVLFRLKQQSRRVDIIFVQQVVVFGTVGFPGQSAAFAEDVRPVQALR